MRLSPDEMLRRLEAALKNPEIRDKDVPVFFLPLLKEKGNVTVQHIARAVELLETLRPHISMGEVLAAW
jgi:hypothetical protein